MSDTATAPILTYQTDLAWGDDADGPGSLDETLVMLTAGTEITYRIVELHGPGGGWPDVKFYGTEADLRVLHERMGPDGESFDFMVGWTD